MEYSNTQRRLPSFKKRSEIVELIQENQIVIISGDTGSGKTTQVPQYILEECGHSARIVVTQPRRVAAISVGERVASEQRCKVGESVGYQVRLDSRPPTTSPSITYCTTGVLLQILQSDPHLQQFTHVVIDEIHERDVLADILLVIMKTVLHQRRDLKLVLMSATLDAEKFSQYMNQCPVLHIPGFMFPVKVHHLEDVFEMIKYEVPAPIEDKNNNRAVLTEDEVEMMRVQQRLSQLTCSNLLNPEHEALNLDLVSELVKYIHKNKAAGAVLIFVPGWEEIQTLRMMLQGEDSLELFPLHGSMSAEDQKKIFKPTQKVGHRKIVIATNIAESSITVNDVVYVVDCGRSKMMTYDPENNVSALTVGWISAANARQRMGRAGRVRSGEVFKLFSKKRESLFTEFMVPEITRVRLEQVMLKLKMLKFEDDFFSQLMDKPEDVLIRTAHQTLIDIGAYHDDHTSQLTALGRTLGHLSSDPRHWNIFLPTIYFFPI